MQQRFDKVNMPILSGSLDCRLLIHVKLHIRVSHQFLVKQIT